MPAITDPITHHPVTKTTQKPTKSLLIKITTSIMPKLTTSLPKTNTATTKAEIKISGKVYKTSQSRTLKTTTTIISTASVTSVTVVKSSKGSTKSLVDDGTRNGLEITTVKNTSPTIIYVSKNNLLSND